MIYLGAFGSGKGGNLVVNASELVQASGLNTGFFVDNSATGDGGDVTITTPVLQLRDGGVIATGTFGTGKSGNLVVNASDSVQISGSVIVDGYRFSSGLRTDAFGEGDSGNLTINTSILLVKDGAVIASSSFPGSTGESGDITVFASDSVQLMSESRLESQTGGDGDAGNIRIDTPLLILKNQAQITADTISNGNAGTIEINAAQLQLDSGGIIESRTLGSGNAGNILLRVEDSVTITGDGSGLFANTEADSHGNGGSIIIDPRIVIIQDEGKISVDSQGTGEGGSILIEADSLILYPNVRISAETVGNTGGNIRLIIKGLLFFHPDSIISTIAGTEQAGGDGGNILIKAGFIASASSENVDIAANAFAGEGGNVTIMTQGALNLVVQSGETLQTIETNLSLGLEESLAEILDLT